MKFKFTFATGGGALAAILTCSMLTADFNNPDCFAQSGVKYATGGNILASTDIFGSTNNASVNFVSNGKKWMTLSPNGLFDISGQTRTRSNAAFDSSVTALTLIAQQAQFSTAVVTGQITAGSLIVNGNATINGQLTTGTLDAQTILQNGNPINQSQWITSVSDIFFMGGNVGIGTSTPSEKLEVDGRVRISSSSDSLPAPVLPPPPPVISPVPRAPSVYTKNPGEESSIIIDGGVDQITATSGRIDFVTTNLVTLGKIGIGTQTPGVPLEVAGTIKVTGPVTNPPSAQQQSILLDGGTDAITATSGTLTFPNTNLVTSGSITSANITTQQLTINGGMLESDTMHARKTFSVNNSLKLERQTTNNFAEVSTIDTSVALVLQRDTSGRGVGIGTMPSAGEKLSVAGDVGIINGNLRVSNLSGTGDRVLYVDQNGNLKLQPTLPLLCFGLDDFWKTDGNDVPPTCDPFIGTKTPKDLVFKTNSDDSTNGGGERMRIMANGDVRFIAGGGNVMIKTDFGPGGAAEAKVGIGTENPVRSLHIYTSHYPDNPPPPCPNNDPNCIPSQGSHMGMRLDDLTQIGNQTPVRTIWDIAPYYNPAIASSGSLVIGKGNLTNESIDAKMILLDNGNVGIGTITPSAKLDVNGTALFSGTVGIGTTSPLSKLHIENNGNVRITLRDASNTSGRFFQIEQDKDLVSFNDNGTKQIINMNLTSGNVGIGTNAPNSQYKLDVNGDINVSGDISFGGVLKGDTKIEGRLIVGDSTILYGIKPTFPHDDFFVAVAGPLVAQEAWVTMTGWGDFVFKNDYTRMSFEEQLKYYPKYKRLLGMPTAEQIEKEGLNTGETLKALTINEEETKLDVLDLYMEVQSLKKEITVLKEEITDIKKKK